MTLWKLNAHHVSVFKVINVQGKKTTSQSNHKIQCKSVSTLKFSVEICAIVEAAHWSHRNVLLELSLPNNAIVPQREKKEVKWDRFFFRWCCSLDCSQLVFEIFIMLNVNVKKCFNYVMRSTERMNGKKSEREREVLNMQINAVSKINRNLHYS